MLGEAPSTAMLTDLVNKANAGSTIQELADHLANDAAFASSFPVWMTAAEFTKKVVDNVFSGSSVSATDSAAAIDYIAGAITAGTFTKTSAVVALTSYLASADGVANTTYGSAAQTYQNKVAVAEYYTITSGQGGATAAERAAAISGVTDAADAVTTAKAAVDTSVADAAAAAKVASAVQETLTTSAETLTGGAGDDSFASVISAGGQAGTTLLPGDVINGGAGNDTLTISTAGTNSGGAAAYTIAAIQTSSVETITFNSFDTDITGDGMVLDMTLMPGVETIKVASGSATGDIKIDNANAIVDLIVNNMSGDVKLNYPAALTSALLGDQTQNVNISNIAATGSTLLTMDGIEVINLDSSTVKSTVEDLRGNGLTTLNITGNADLTITQEVEFKDAATATAVDGTIDASKFTGKLSMTLPDDVMKITGGSANDTFKMVGTLTGLDVIDGGDGVDTITMTNAALTTQLAKVTNVETLKFNAIADTAVNIDVSKVGGIATVQMDVSDSADSGAGGADTSNRAHTVTKLDGKMLVLAHTTEDAADADDSDGADVTVTDTVDGATDTVNITLANIGRDLHTSTDYFGYDTLNVGSYETINLTANANAAGTNAFNEIDHLTATAATTITVDGTGAFETVLAGTKVTSFDASGLAGALTLTTGANKIDVKMGGKSSTVNFGANLSNTDKVTGGAGAADIVTATMASKTAASGKVDVSGVEVISYTTSGANTLDMSGTSGLGMLVVTDNKQTITGFSPFTQLVLGSTTDASDTASEVDVSLVDASGATDALNVAVNVTAGAATTIVDASGIESLSMTSQRSTNGTAALATVDLTTFEGTSVSLATGAAAGTAAVVAGGSFALGQTHKNTTTVTSTVKGAVTHSFAKIVSDVDASYTGLGSGVQNLTGGAGADTFNIGATAGVAHVISGGGGTDTTNLAVATNFVDPSTINTENLNLTVGAAVDNTLTGGFNAGVDNITLLGGNSLSVFTNAAAVKLDGGVKTVDASGFAGAIDFTIDDDALDSTLTITGGPLATDRVTAVQNAAGTDIPKLTGVEIVEINNDATATLSLAGSTGVSRVEIDVAASQTATVTALGTETIRIVAGAGDSVVEASLTDATGATDAVTFDLRDAGSNLAAAINLKTTDIETVNITATSAESIDLSELAMTSATKTVKVVTGLTATSPNALTVSALSAQVTTVDASAGFGFIQTGRSAATASNYTGSAGADTFIMMTSSDTITGGSVAAHGTALNTDANDTLDLNYTAVLGGLSINLNSATNQIATMDGGPIAGSVTGFENAVLDGFQGGGAVVIAAATGSSVTGTGVVDRITGGASADTVTVSAGADVIALGGGNDIAKFTAAQIEAQNGTSATYNFGSGTADDLQVADASTGLVDADFAGITNVEKLTLSATGNNSVALGAIAVTSGIGSGTVTDGAGNLALTLADTTSVSVTTAAGNDNIIATAATVGGIASDAVIKFTTINDWAANDKITFTIGGTNAFTTAAVDVTGGDGTLKAALDIAVSAAGHINNQITWFALGGNSYIVNHVVNSTDLAAGDQVVKLVGTFDLSDETFAEGGGAASSLTFN
jgi:hypothetical protein